MLMTIDMEETSEKFHDQVSLINSLFSATSKNSIKNEKWSVLKEFQEKYLEKSNMSVMLFSSYHSVTSTLLDALKPTIFDEKWQENQFDNIFLCGIHHEAFMILVRKLDTSG